MAARRALVISATMPEYDRESGSRRVFHLLELLQETGWQVTFFTDAPAGDARYARTLQQRGIAVYSAGTCQLDGIVAANRFQVAIIAFWFIAETYMPVIRRASPDTRIVVDTIDVHFMRHARRTLHRTAQGSMPGVLDPNYASEMAREVNAYAAADAVLCVSQKEADLINDLTSRTDLAHALPDIEDTPRSDLPFEDRNGILFLGNFRHPPNVEAVEYLCTEILPLVDPAITAEHPVYIVGNELNDAVWHAGAGLPYVRMVGWVPSVLPYLHRARISVLPLLYGAGTKRKLIQSLMAGTPTVSTTIGIEGLQLRDGEHVLVADEPGDFAESISRLLRDRNLWDRLARDGKAFISMGHGRLSGRDKMMEILASALLQR